MDFHSHQSAQISRRSALAKLIAAGTSVSVAAAVADENSNADDLSPDLEARVLQFLADREKSGLYDASKAFWPALSEKELHALHSHPREDIAIHAGWEQARHRGRPVDQ